MQNKPNLTWAEARELISANSQEFRSAHICESPLVSVCLITYNHRSFIREAIESVLAQETSFPFEIIIGDDCSSDGTADIVCEFQSRRPDRISVLLATNNLGIHTGNGRLNFIRTLEACRGKYITVLEGDDFWTDPSKLSRQVAHLDANPHLSMCHHLVSRISEEDKRTNHTYFPGEHFRKELSIEDLTIRNFIQTCSVMLRGEHLQHLPDEFINVIMGDWPLFMLVARYGRIGYINDVMATYRIHAGGTWSSRSYAGRIVGTIEMLEAMEKHLPANCLRSLKKCIRQFQRRLAFEYLKQGRLIEAHRAIMRSFKI